MVAECFGRCLALDLADDRDIIRSPMKVLDLQCPLGHRFEAWFGSEQDYVSQTERGLVACPSCGDTHVVKMLSAPRLNLGAAPGPRAAAADPASKAPAAGHPVAAGAGLGEAGLAQLHAAWLALSKEIAASSEDVGSRFAEEARKMHYGEAENRSIRGTTSLAEVHELHEEGIAVMPLAVPDGTPPVLH